MTTEALRDVLECSRDLGFLGPGRVEDHIEHARAFLPLLDYSRRVVDLGSGGGVPGLVLACELPSLEMVLVDAMDKRCRFLRGAVPALGLEDRVRVEHGRAEDLARRPALRRAFDTVVARSFGPPAVTAECAVGFLDGPGARVLVSEPPRTETSRERWPAAGLGLLGLVPDGRVDCGSASIQVLRLVELPDDRYPRPTGRPGKRPLF